MASMFGSLNAALSGLYAAQRMVEVSGHNIENMNTAGYTKQRISQKALGLSSVTTIFGGASPMSGGVELEKLQRMGDIFLDNKLRLESGNAAHAKELQNAWSTMEKTMNEFGDVSVSKGLQQFFAGWGDVASSPNNDGARSKVKGDAEMLVMQIGEGYSRIATLWKDTRQQVDASVADLNGTLDSIAALNDRIVREKNAGADVNELIDQRAQLVLKVSKLTGATGRERDDGSIEVMLSGNSMVSKDFVNHIKVAGAADMPGIDTAPKDVFAQAETAFVAMGAPTTTETLKDVHGQDTGIARYQPFTFVEGGKSFVAYGDMSKADPTTGRPSPTDILGGTKFEYQAKDFQNDEGPVRLVWEAGGHGVVMDSGSIGGKLQNLAPAKLPGANGSIGSGGTFAEVGKLYNDMVLTLAHQVNGIHQGTLGDPTYTLVKTGAVTTTVENGVTITSPEYKKGSNFFDFNAADNKLPPALRLKVAIKDPAEIAASKMVNGTYDGAVANDMAKAIDNPMGATLKWNNSVVDIGVHTQSSGARGQLSEQARRIAERAHQSGTGVEMNEEVVNLIQGQHAYSAAARVMSTVNQMLDDLVNLGRR